MYPEAEEVGCNLLNKENNVTDDYNPDFDGLSGDLLIANLLQYAYNCAAGNSDDPVTRNGAVLWHPFSREIKAAGANRLPRGIESRPERLERPLKYKYMVHAERDVIFRAAACGRRTAGLELYCPWAACAECAQAIIQAGIRKVFSHQQAHDLTPERWRAEIVLADEMLAEAGVAHVYYDGFIGGVTALMDGQTWTP
jgi:dCMP deaminase